MLLGLKLFKMIDWIREHKELLSIRAIEQKAQMPDSTLTKAVNGSQKLPKKWEEPLHKILMVLQKPQRVSQK